MAGRKKAEKTPVSKAFEAAKAAHKAAKERLDKADNPQNQSAAKSAKDKLAEATKAMNRERFVTVGNTRLTKAIAALNNFGKVANARSYSFTADDAKKANDAIDMAVKAVKSAFEVALKTGTSDKKGVTTATFFE